MYVQALLDVHNKYAAMVESSFTGDSGFLQSLDKVGGTMCVLGATMCGGPCVCYGGGGGGLCVLSGGPCVFWWMALSALGLPCGESSYSTFVCFYN